MNNIKKYIDEVTAYDLDTELTTIDYDLVELKISKNEMSKEHLAVLILYSSFMNYMHNVKNAETIDIAAFGYENLKKSNLELKPSDTFMDAIFNFNSVYRPLYDLLDLATNHKFAGKIMSEDYRLGVLDSIVALRRYQRYSGFGDHEWADIYNTAIDKVIDINLDNPN
jgi:hypothetical protein